MRVGILVNLIYHLDHVENVHYLLMHDTFATTNKNVSTLYLLMINDDSGIHYEYVFADEAVLDNSFPCGTDVIENPVTFKRLLERKKLI